MDTDIFIQFSNFVEFRPITFEIIVAAILAAMLLLCSAYASGSEIAFFSLSPNDIEELEESKLPADNKVCQLRENSERTLATILIANNFINVTIVMLSNYIFNSIVIFKVEWLEILCITILLTFLLLLFGEIMPKVYCRQNSLKFCRFAAGGILILQRILLHFL